MLPPRFFLILFRFAQPILISRTITFLSGAEAEESGRLSGGNLIWATVLIYGGIAVICSNLASQSLD